MAALRIALGLVFVLAAPASRAPRTLRVLGVIVIIAGLTTPSFGVAHARAGLARPGRSVEARWRRRPRARGLGLVGECTAVVHTPCRRRRDSDWWLPRVRFPGAGAGQVDTGAEMDVVRHWIQPAPACFELRVGVVNQCAPRGVRFRADYSRIGRAAWAAVAAASQSISTTAVRPGKGLPLNLRSSFVKVPTVRQHSGCVWPSVVPIC